MTAKEMTMQKPVLEIAAYLIGIQGIIFYTYWLLYQTLTFAFLPSPAVQKWLGVALFILSISFTVLQITANLWSFRGVDILYTGAAFWIGTMHFLTMACAAFWAIAEIIVPLGAVPPWEVIGGTLFTLAILTSIYATFRSFRPQYVRYYLTIPNLPAAWKGRKAILVSDVHLGNVRAQGSARKLARMVNAERPDIVFIPGDLFDGPPADFDWLVEPFKDIQAPHGTYFTEGNHEEFGDPEVFLKAIRGAGIKVLNKEMDVVDGMQILGVPYDGSNTAEEVRDSLAAIPYDPEKPSILLKHAPSSPRAAAVAGVSLMLSGHTHNAQVWPFQIFIRQLFGRAGYGYTQSNNMQLITTSGYGTWGPPQRFGTKAEVVVIKFS